MDHGTKYIKETLERQIIFWENQQRSYEKEYLRLKEMEYSEKTTVEHWKEGYYQGKEQGSEEVIKELEYLLKIIEIYNPSKVEKKKKIN